MNKNLTNITIKLENLEVLSINGGFEEKMKKKAKDKSRKDKMVVENLL